MNAVPEQPALEAGAATGLGDLAQYTGDYVRAWSELFAGEAQLARVCVNRLLLAAVWTCFLVFGIVISGNVLTAALLERWLTDWASAIALTLLLNFIVLIGLLLAMRAWWRNLSLPRSRRALRHLMQRLHETDRASAAR
jgi:uncharacterized membrane protein YidH (DUF202 family)